MRQGAKRHHRDQCRRGAGAALWVCAAVATAGAAGMGSGCSEPLFPRKEPMTQFERYDEARRQSVEPWLEDEFGRRRPNLRGRLLQNR